MIEDRWTAASIPDLSNKTAVVTGAKRDLGQMIIRRLSEHGANVFAISRDEMSPEEIVDGIEPVRMNPTSMESIQHGAERIREQVDNVDILIHAASISVAPRFRTAEGHELMLATNYLGFVMLAHALATSMMRSPEPRVVLTGSGEPIKVDLDLDHLDADSDLRWEVAYAQSRLAAMMFALELGTRAQAAKSRLLAAVGEAPERNRAIESHHPIRRQVHWLMDRARGMAPDFRVAPVLFASTAERAQGGHYYAPERRGRLRAEPITRRLPPHAADPSLRNELWQRTEDLLGVRLDVG